MALRSFSSTVSKALTRSFHLSRCNLDGRSIRLGHVKQSDAVDGERAIPGQVADAYELLEDNFMDKVIDNVKFKDIPVIYLKCTRNNTKCKILLKDGSLLAYKTGGSEGFKHCRKGTTVAGQAVANRILTIALDNEIKMARLVFDGLGPGRNAAYKVFEMNSKQLKIISLTDRTQAAEPFNLRPRAAKSL